MAVTRPSFRDKLSLYVVLIAFLFIVGQLNAQSVVKVGLEQVPSAFDPFSAYSGAEATFFGLFFDSLYRFSPISSTVIPWLAADLPTVVTIEDRIHLSIPLRMGIRWHSGDPFVAEDVLYTLREIYLSPKHPQSFLWGEVIVSVGAKGDHELVLVANRDKVGYLFQILSLPIYPNRFAVDGPVGVEEIVGTGPFVYNDKLGADYLTVRRNWWYHANGWNIDGGTVGPHMSGILFKQVASGDVQKAFDQDDIDLFLGPISADPATEQMFFTDRLRLLAFNLRCRPGSDHTFRQAVAAVISTFLPDLVQGAGGHPIDFPLPTEAASTILQKGGYSWDSVGGLLGPGGEVLPPVRVVLVTEGEGSLRDAFAASIVRELRDLGVAVDIYLSDASNIMESVFGNHDYDLLIYGWKIQQGFPIHLVELLYSGTIGQFGPNVSGFEQEEYDNLVTALLASDESANVFEIQVALEGIIQEELPLIPLFYAEDGVAYSANSQVAGYFSDGGGFWSFAGLHFKP